VTAGCALLGGETAEHPGLLEPDEYDVAGSTTGVVEAEHLLGPGRVEPGDLLVAMGSSGLHSNGYSLARHVFLAQAGWALDREVPELGRTLGDELLEPTRIYAKACLELARRTRVHAMAHITGGGLAGNLARVLPDGVAAEVDRGTWAPQPVFSLLGDVGRVERPELEATFNMGVGMVALVHREDADEALAVLGAADRPAWVCGEVTAGDGRVRLHGDYA
jgi:phosphoribosylformylglycinamidine cyclo-ligase